MLVLIRVLPRNRQNPQSMQAANAPDGPDQTGPKAYALVSRDASEDGAIQAGEYSGMHMVFRLLAALLIAVTAIQPPAPVAAASAMPRFDHVYLVVMENKPYKWIVGNPDAPYLNSLVANYGLATNDYAVTHPSEPNYLALFAGSTFGVTDDAVYDFGGSNLADQLGGHRRTWHVYAQD